MSSAPFDDYYVLLGVSAAASDEQLRRAWRDLAARWHPDRAGEAATEKFQRIAAAYAVLSDPLARAAYDRRCRLASGTGGMNASRAKSATKSPPRPARPAAPAIMLSRLCGSLVTLLACGAARLDDPGYITLVLGEAEAAQGGMASISMRVELWCPDCAGKPRDIPCRRCAGTKIIEELYSAWLAIWPGIAPGEVLTPSAELPGMVEPVRFRVGMSKRNG